MLKRVLFRAAAVAAALALGASSAQADFIIDDFTQPPAFTGLIGITGNGVQSATRTDNYSTSVGPVTRVLTVNQTQNVLGNNATQYGIGSITPGSGIFTLATANGSSVSTGTTANASLLYTYSAPQNLSVAGTSLQFTFAGADLGTPYSVQISDGVNTSTQSGSATQGAGVYSISLSSFAGSVSQSVTSILLTLNRDLSGANQAVASADFTLSDVRVLTPPPVDPPQVPAPPAAVLVLAAVPLLGLARARRLLPV